MPKFDLENFDPNDTHSVNISLYKPDGLLSFWNWFTRKNKNNSQHKNIQFKITKEDLERIKLTGFDLQKLQNLNFNNKNKTNRQCNVFAIPKADLDPFLLKTLHPAINSKTYVKRLISKSTISIRSKESCSDLKYTRSVKSQSSKGSFRASVLSKTNIHVQSHPQLKSVFLKSVPTTVLRSNTKKLLILGKEKSPRGQKTTKTSPPDNLNNQPHSKENSVIPALLTRMKSMEQHLSDIGNTTKKINDAVSQRNIMSSVNHQDDLRKPEQSKPTAAKYIAAHKIYSKNIHVPKKNRKRQQKKSKVKSKTNVCAKNRLKINPQNNGFAFNNFSDSSNEIKNINELRRNVNSFDKSGSLLNQNLISLPNNIKCINLSPENSNKADHNLIMSVVKALTQTRGFTNLYQGDNSTNQQELQGQKSNAEVGVVNLGSRNFPSKSTFDWKHNSVTALGKPHISESTTTNKVDNKIKKNTSVALGKQDYNQSTIEKSNDSNQILNPHVDQKIIFELVMNENNEKEPTSKETENFDNAKMLYLKDFIENVEIRNKALEDTDKKARSMLSLESKYYEAENQECVKRPSEFCSKHTGFGDSKGSCEETKVLHLKDRQSQWIINNKELNKIPLESNSLIDIVTCVEDMPENNDLVCGETSSRITLPSGVLCNVNIHQQSAIASSPDKLFKRTTGACSDDKKEPKVSITILVEDSMKNNVEMKSILLKNSQNHKEEHIDQLDRQECHSPSTNFGPKGDHIYIQLNKNRTKSLLSSENLSRVSCSVSNKDLKEPLPKEKVNMFSHSRKNKNFYVEVPDERKHFNEEYLSMCAPGTYLNYEKRKVLDEKVLGLNKHNKSAPMQTGSNQERISPTRSYSNVFNTTTSFDQMIEASFITQEMSFSKTKFNICNEKKYSSKASTIKPYEIYKKDSFSEESIASENNIDVSTKFTSQQCVSVSYCRNNNVTNFRRDHFSQYNENILNSPEVEKQKQPFVIVHTPKNCSDTLETNSNKNKLSSKQKSHDLALREQPILEVSEDESETTNLENNPVSNHTDENNYPPVTPSPDLNSQHTVEINSTADPESRKTAALISEVKATEEIQCQTVLKESNKKHCEEKDITLDQSKNSVSCTLQTVLSSTSVQTDWSLVGITADHLNYSSVNFARSDCKQRSIASQTEVMMDQIALVSKGLEDKLNCCKSCMKNSQFSELVACSVNMSHNVNLQDTLKGISDSKQADPVAIIMDKYANRFEFDSEIEETEYNNQRMLGVNVFKQIVFPKFTDKTMSTDQIAENLQNHKNIPEEVVSIVRERGCHRCTIPCLATLSDETVMSNLSESGYQNVITYQDSQDYHSVPQMNRINGGILIYCSAADDEKSSNNWTTEAEGRPIITDSNWYHSVFKNLTLDDNECPTSQSSHVMEILETDKETTINELFTGDTCSENPVEAKYERRQCVEKSELETPQEIKSKRNEKSKMQGEIMSNTLKEPHFPAYDKSIDYITNN